MTLCSSSASARQEAEDAVSGQDINFHQTDADTGIFALHDRCVGAGGESADDGGFARIRRWDSRVDNFLFLVRLPIIIGGEQSAVAVVQFQSWVLERVRHPLTGQ